MTDDDPAAADADARKHATLEVLDGDFTFELIAQEHDHALLQGFRTDWDRQKGRQKDGSDDTAGADEDPEALSSSQVFVHSSNAAHV